MENETTITTPEVTPAATPTTSTNIPLTTSDSDNNLIMGIFCYLGVLVIIPYLMAKDNPFVKFHLRQGIVLAGLWIILYVAREMIIPWRFVEIVRFAELALIILSVIGIIFVIQKKETALPIIGGLANKVKI
ncbi:MAG: hypothetical protein AUK16_02085 [Parcubacteria group bacterium CG2_30_44_11]|nr:MAG: hypothetical protein AUK16_02085 [Parcubacteria group bacterium CG2_30_44_11]